MSHLKSGGRFARLFKPRALAALAISAAALTSGVASAQQATFYLDRLQMSGAPDDGLVLFRPHLHEKTRFYANGGLGYTLNPLRPESLTDDPTVQRNLESPVAHQLNLYLNAGFEFLGRFAVGVSLPIAVYQDGGEDPIVQEVGDGLGRKKGSVHDFRLNGKVKVYQSDNRRFTLGVGGAIWFPSGNSRSFTGDNQTTGWLYGAGEYDFGNFQVAGLLGPHFRPQHAILGTNGDLEVTSELRWAAGVFFPLRNGQMRVGGNLWGTTGIDKGNVSGKSTFFMDRNTDIEWLAEMRVALQKSGPWYFSGGGGTRLSAGYGGPDVRLLATIGAWTTLADKEPGQSMRPRRKAPDVEMRDRDTDGDGYPDDIDLCPTEKEDGKPPEKSDGCPDRKSVV